MNASLSPGTVLIMAGGTGGHIMPGLAVAELLKAKAWKVVWLGHPEGMEARLVAQHGFPMRWVRFGGLRGKGLLTTLMLPFNLLRAFWQALIAVRSVQPSVVLGLGGYISFPGGMMASLLGKPLVLHEQNSVAGLANKVLAQVADRVLVAFPGALPKAAVCGNPVRQAILDLAHPKLRYAQRSGALRVLIVGGSLGAQALNQTLPAALGELARAGHELPEVRHQTGRAQKDATQAAYAAQGVQATVHCTEFIEDMAQAYGWADLVICRAGALTVSELAAAGVASWLVPFPHAVDDHQTGNARYLSDRNAAVLMPQSTLSATGLATALANVSRAQCEEMAVLARAAAHPEATAQLAQACIDAASR